ncbi:hypothetical protein LSTR_LSTR012476 [Laodelphax striatellus]|uniref:TOG domain-containing protein n=1 Tax=Laodelphax striatellus TaxID=195883 RepID=A0A482WNV9_LAOST|nr:hypothetical protein LSTR_LSTR012476 [Laodelphax striatellus]
MDEENTEYIKLPVTDRCVHKLWKARVHGYTEAAKLFQQIDDEKSPEWNKFLGLVKKFVIDSNAVAQEKGLEAVLAFVENSAVAGKTVGEVMSGIVAKCIGAPKAKTKELAAQITLMYIEQEKQEIVIEELLKGTEHKNPKVVCGCINVITQAIREFGVKVVNVKPLVKRIPALLEDRDKGVRDEGKAMVVEMHRWIGAALSPQLTALKPVQMAELEAEFEKGRGQPKATPTRWLRSQQARQAKEAAEAATDDAGAGGDDEEEVDGQEIDPYELMEPVNILAKLPKDFYDKVEAKKWQERKEAMEVLEGLLKSAPKLENGDYFELVKALKKLISKDSNVVVVALATKNLGGLASGLKKRYSQYASTCIPVLLEKFREKKANVVTALRDAIDAVYQATTLEAIQEDVLAALDNKNPSVKAETALFMARCFQRCTTLILTKKLLKVYTAALCKTLNEPDPTVRDNSAEALGTAMKVVSEKAITPFLENVDSLKLAKSKSSAAKVATERELSDEEVQEKAEAILSPEILNGLADSNWKTRLAVMEQFTQILGTLEPASVSSQVLFKILNKKPGIKDTNFQVAKLKLEAVKTIATTFPVTSVGVSCILLDVVDKMNEAKTSTIASECLTELAEATRLEAVSGEVLDYSMNRQKSPKVQVEVFNWLSTALLEFGFQVNAKALMENVKKGVAATNPVVRTAAISLLGTLYVFMGPQLHLFFENEKPALVQQINAECDKRSGETAPAAVRGLRRFKSQDLLEDGGGDEEAGEEDSRPPATPCIQDIVPRTDITGYITDALVSELQDKNWKVRSEAIQKLQNIINELRFISGSLGEAAPLLGARLTDSNSKIAQNAIALCESLATASGTAGCKQYVRHVFPGLLQCTGDSKAWIRTAAVSCINTYGELCGYKEFFDGEMIYDALKGGSPALRAEVWSWLSAKLPNLKTVPKEELLVCLPVLFANLEDRNADVRKNASEALVGFMYHLGYSPMMSACEKLKPASSIQVRGLLDKARCLVPERPPPPGKAGAPAKGGAGAASGGGAAGAAKGAAKMAPGSSATITKSSSKLKTVNSAKSSSAGSRKEEEVDVTPLLPTNNLKNQRVIDEQKLKTLKWNFTTPRDEFVELLRDQMTAAGVNKTLIANMFHADFKFHLKAIDQLNEDLGSHLQALACNLDLILRWMTLRFFDTNPSVILKGLEYLQTAFNMLIEDDYIMLENEASAFIPYLVLKVGDPKDAVRNSVRALFKQIVLMYPVSKFFTYIMDGLKSKNARQRSECLDQLGYLIESVGTTVCQPSAGVALKEIAKHISDRDNSVRSGALNCIVAAYFLDGEKVLKTVGQISDKDMSLLEERIKRAAKNRPVASIKPMPPAASRPGPVRAGGGRAATPDEPLDEPEEEEVEEEAPHPQQVEAVPQSDENLNSSGDYESPCFRPVQVNTDIHDDMDLNTSPPRSQPQPVTGPYRLDPDFLASIEVPVNIQRPNIKEVDLSFLREPVPQISRPPKLSATSPLSKLAHPSTIEGALCVD